MRNTNSVVRNRSKSAPERTRVLFELRRDLLDQIRQVADENEVSVSAFLRESARRNISLYRSQKAAL
jgi:hypothetical protein